jgi:hypothetical protein
MKNDYGIFQKTNLFKEDKEQGIAGEAAMEKP